MKRLKNLKLLKKSSKYNLKDQAELLENLSLFLNRGFSLTDTINLLNLRFGLSDMIEGLEEGELMSDILKTKKVDEDALLIIEIAERSGELALGIENAYKILKQKIKNKEEVKKLLKYPILLCVITIAALGFVSFFLIPKFESIYESFNLEGNGGITFLFSFIRNLPIIGLLILAVFVFSIIWYVRKSKIEQMQFCLKNRFIKKSYLVLYNHIFTINVVNLLKVGLKIDELFTILANQEYNILLSQESKKILLGLEEGLQLHECLDEYYLPELKMLIKEGEHYSTLLHNLDNYVIFLNQKQQNKTQKMFFLIQPVFYGFFGLLIVLLYSTIFMPMFKMMEQF